MSLVVNQVTLRYFLPQRRHGKGAQLRLIQDSVKVPRDMEEPQEGGRREKSVSLRTREEIDELQCHVGREQRKHTAASANSTY